MVTEIDLNTGRPLIMGVMNITPDSFYAGSRCLDGSMTIDDIVRRAVQIEADGADILDIGAESSRPDAAPLSEQEELDRLLPVLEAVDRAVSIPISIDTCKGVVARRVLTAGFSHVAIINDIKGLTGEDNLLGAVVDNTSYVVIMHMRGTPRNMQRDVVYGDLIADIHAFLTAQVRLALRAGVLESRIIIDPGIGFGKSRPDNIDIIKRLDQFMDISRNILIGASRKSFIGHFTGAPVEARLPGSLAAVGCAVRRGASIIRVHDVAETVQYLKIMGLIEN